MPTLKNWNDEIQFDVHSQLFKTPETIPEVQAIVKQAYEQDQKVTVIGAMHSTTECMVGSGVIIAMEKMNNILSVDRTKLTATVQGGVSLHDLCGYLKKQHLQPPVILEWGNFHIGAISGTHANDSSVTLGGQFSSFVAGVKLVTPKGELMEISETQNSEYLPAIRSHFGLFGVVCEVTVHILESQPLHMTYQLKQIDSFLDRYDEELEALKTNFSQVFGVLFPSTGKLLFQCRKFVLPGTPNPHPLTDGLEGKAINLFADVVLPLSKFGLALRPSADLAQLLNDTFFDLPLKVLQHSSYIIDPCERAIIYAEDDPNFEFYDWVFAEDKWPEMVGEYLQLCDTFRREHNFISPLPALVYFIKQDQGSLLSRSRNANMMAIDPEYPDPKDPNWKSFRLAFGELAAKHGGIPHMNKTRDGAINHFAKVFDQDIIKQYLELRKKFDPKNLFLNDFYETCYAGYL